MKYVVLDYRVDADIVDYFDKIGLEIIYTKKIPNIIPAIDGHVDIQMFYDGKKIVVAKENYEYYREKFSKEYLDEKGIEIIPAKENLKFKYPGDVKLNLCYTGKYYIGNYTLLDENIKKYIAENKLGDRFINISQGYANCSLCVVDEDCIITSDKGIKTTIDEYNKNNIEKIECVLVEIGDIELFELNYGFLGGCCGKSNEDKKLYFFGEIDTHSSSKKIVETLKKHDIEYIELKKKKLIDYGGLYLL